MKTNSKETDIGMAYYLKKFWKANILATLPILTVCALQTGTSLVMIRTFQSIIERDLRGFGVWIVMMVGTWFLLLGINSLQKFFQGRAIRAMNNAVRQGMTFCASLVGSSGSAKALMLLVTRLRSPSSV